MKKLFLSASAIFASIPGIAIIISGLGSPPGQKILFGGVIETLGALSLLILWLNRGKIKRFSLKKVTRLAIILGVAGFLSLLIYLWLFSFCVVSLEGRKPVYYPIYTSGKVAELIEKAGSRPAAIERYGSDDIIEKINEMPGNPLGLTTVLLLFVYQLIFTTLAVGFGLLGIRLKEDFVVETSPETLDSGNNDTSPTDNPNQGFSAHPPETDQ